MSSSYYSSSSNFEQINELIPDYKPFIADVSISSFGEPFPITTPDTRSDDEINLHQFRLRKYLKKKYFDPPIKLSDFCLIAKTRWENEDSSYSSSSESKEEEKSNCLLL